MEENEEGLDGYDIEKILDELNAKYLITEIFAGDDIGEGYACVYLESEDDDKNLLLDLGFEEIRKNFFIITLDKLPAISSSKVEELKLLQNRQLDAIQKKNDIRKRKENLGTKWAYIIERFEGINSYCIREFGHNFFDPTHGILILSLRLPIILVKDDKSLEEFCRCLFQFSKESIATVTLEKIYLQIVKIYGACPNDKNKEEYVQQILIKDDRFLRDIKFLRNYSSHLKKNKNDELKFKQCYISRGIKKLKSEDEYFLFQLKLLHGFKEYLTELNENIKTKL